MNYSLRRALDADWPFIAALYARPHVTPCLHSPSAEDFHRSLEREGCRNFIVERDGTPFGNMTLVERSWLMNARALAIWEPARGAGRAALEYAIEHSFKEAGAHRIFLEVLESNSICRRLVEAVGFRSEGLYRDGYRDENGVYHNLVPYGLLNGDRPSESRYR